MLWYEKHIVVAFYSPETLVNVPQFVGERYLPGDIFVSCYKVSIFLIHAGYRVEDGIGFHGCDDIFGQRNFPVCVQE